MADFQAKFTFNGLDSMTDLGVKLLKFALPLSPSMSVVSEDVPAKYGNEYEGTNFGAKSFSFSVYLDTQMDAHKLNQITQTLSSKLIYFNPLHPNEEFPLTFDFEPDVTFMGHFSAIRAPQLLQNSYLATVELTFEMSDGRAYLPQEVIDNRVSQSENLLKKTSDDVQTGNATGWGDAMQYYISDSEVIPAGSKVTGQAWLAPTGHNFSLNILGTDSNGNLVWLSKTSVSAGGNIAAGQSGYTYITAIVPTDLHHVELYSSLSSQVSDSTALSWKEAKLCVWPDTKTEPDMTWSPARGEEGYSKPWKSITVDGTAEADPVLSIIPQHDTKFVGYNCNGRAAGIGSDEDSQQANVQQKYVNDNAGTLAPWTQDTTAIAPITTAMGFKAQGTLASNTNTSSISVGKKSDGTFDFGTYQKDGWYGPVARNQGLSQSLSDFKMVVMIHHKTYTGIHNLRAMGDVEFLLLDPNGQTFGRCAIKSQSGGHVPYVIFQVGTAGSKFASDSDHHTFYNGKGVNFTDKKNVTVKVPNKVKTGKKTKRKYISVVNAENTSAITDGWLQFTLEREGNVYKWSIIQFSLYTGLAYKDAKRHLIVHGQWVDAANKFTSKLGSFGLMFLKNSLTEDSVRPAVPYRNVYMSLTDLQVYKINQITPTLPKYVANKGQEILIDSANQRITVDGKLSSNVVWSTEYPVLLPGDNIIDVVGDQIDDAFVTITYNPRKR